LPSPATTADATTDALRTGRAVILVNKPFGVLCQFTTKDERRTLADYVRTRDVYAAGRLDADSEGLVVLTANGALQARIAHPRHSLGKTYWVQVEGEATPAQIASLSNGVELRDGYAKAQAARVMTAPDGLWARHPPIRVRRAIPTSWLAITLSEGRNRQVRRMTAAVGLPTLRLIRWSIGQWTLEGLGPGECRAAGVL
jgi:23S rRNA pseudouridine2457 synthase